MWLCANEKQGNLEFISEENQLVREKFLFMRDLYQETLQDKKRYKNKSWQ